MHDIPYIHKYNFRNRWKFASNVYILGVQQILAQNRIEIFPWNQNSFRNKTGIKCILSSDRNIFDVFCVVSRLSGLKLMKESYWWHHYISDNCVKLLHYLSFPTRSWRRREPQVYSTSLQMKTIVKNVKDGMIFSEQNKFLFIFWSLQVDVSTPNLVHYYWQPRYEL